MPIRSRNPTAPRSRHPAPTTSASGERLVRESRRDSSICAPLAGSGEAADDRSAGLAAGLTSDSGTVEVDTSLRRFGQLGKVHVMT